MNAKIRNSIFVAAFILMLLIPWVGLDLQGGQVSEEEKRVLAERPPLSSELTAKEYIGQFDSWFSDNIGVRNTCISLYQGIEGINQAVQYTEGGYIFLNGREGHRYFAYDNGWLIEKFQGHAVLSDVQLETVTASLNQFAADLNQQGIPVLAFIPPDKESVYPEYYPNAIIPGPQPIQLDIVTDYLNENTTFPVYNSKERLIAEKENFLVYNKSYGDLEHYNSIGGFFEYQELMAHLKEYYPETQVLTLDDIDITYDSDNIPVITQHQTNYQREPEGYFQEVVLEPNTSWACHAYINEDRELPKILVMGDSYAMKYGNFVANHFSDAVFIHYSNIMHLQEYVDYFQPDIVVFEVAERELRSFAELYE